MLGLPRSLLAVACMYAAAWSCGLERGSSGEGSPCTRTADCRYPLTCSAGVCRGGPDGGVDAGRDASFSFDAEAGAELDAGELDAGELDAGELDAGDEDAGELDAGDEDAGELDAAAG